MPLKRRRALPFGWLIYALIAGQTWAGVPNDSPSPTMRYALTVSNPTGSVVSDVQLRVYAPVTARGHSLSFTATANEPFDEEFDLIGNRALRFSRQQFPPYSSKRYVVTFRGSDQPSLDSSQSKESTFLAAEPFVESDAPEIIEAVALIRRLEPNDDFPIQAYKWVASHVIYSGFSADDRGALYALREAKGDCTEYASLFVALMRAVGIPARVVGGWVLKDNSAVRAADFHNWAEFFSDGQWRTVDPQRRVFGNNNETYIRTRIVQRGNTLPYSYRFAVSHPELQVTWD